MGFGSKYARKVAQRGVTDIEEKILMRGVPTPERIPLARRELNDFEKKLGTSVIKEVSGTEALRFILKAVKRFRKHAGDPKKWLEAFKHIKLHFVADPNKPTHTIFAPQFRSSDAVKELIDRALEREDKLLRLSRRTQEGARVGQPSAQIEVRFDEAIGHTTAGDPCHFLRIITDLTGRPITAFPARELEIITR